MCDTCGCENNEDVKIYSPESEQENETHPLPHHHHGIHANEDHHHHIELGKDILSKNDLQAEYNRGFFEALDIFTLNMVSSPGSGKTTLIERIIQELGDQLIFYVIEGDQQTANDAKRIQKAGGKAIQVNTGNGCHLDANMVHKAIKQLNPDKKAVLIIENVGNLVCPSLFDLGEKKRVLIFSVPEGDDKPEKYPNIFHTSDVCIINKTDLMPYVDFDVQKARSIATQLNPEMEFFKVSAKTGEGMEDWYKWLISNA